MTTIQNAPTKSRGGWYFAAVVLFMWLTNPSYAKHQREFVRTYNEKHPVAKYFTAPGLVADLSRYNNYLLFSTTTLQGESVTFGILGIVFTTAKGI